MKQITNTENFPGRHWQVLDNGKVQCDVCPRQCQLNDGQRGFVLYVKTLTKKSY